jgi:hypothetical protein
MGRRTYREFGCCRSFWLSQIDSARWQEEACQRSWYLAKFLSPSDILGRVWVCSVRKEGWGGKMTCIANGIGHRSPHL